MLNTWTKMPSDTLPLTMFRAAKRLRTLGINHNDSEAVALADALDAHLEISLTRASAKPLTGVDPADPRYSGGRPKALYAVKSTRVDSEKVNIAFGIDEVIERLTTLPAALGAKMVKISVSKNTLQNALSNGRAWAREFTDGYDPVTISVKKLNAEETKQAMGLLAEGTENTWPGESGTTLAQRKTRARRPKKPENDADEKTGTS